MKETRCSTYWLLTEGDKKHHQTISESKTLVQVHSRMMSQMN